MGRPPCCDKANVKRGLWTAEEDAKILAYVATHGTGNWTLVPKKAGLNRCGKSCRLRWTNYLRPDLNHSSFTSQEEDLILKFHKAIGSRWSLIAKQLPGRTDNDVKNYWNTKLRKKLADLRIDPVTHKPFSQVISEFGVIGGSGAAPPNPASTVPVGPPMVPESAYYSLRAAAAINPNFPLSAFRDGVVTPPVGTDFRFGSSDPLRDEKFQSDHASGNENGGFGALGYEAGSSSCSRSLMVGSSFVEEILDRDSEMQREFPCAFMDESFYC